MERTREFDITTISNLKGQSIEFQDVPLYVVEQIDYNNETYLCTLEYRSLPQQAIVILKRINQSQYQFVGDRDTINKVIGKIGALNISYEIGNMSRKSF